MANITFTEGSGLQDSIFGKSQEPIKLFLEKRGEAFEQQSMIPPDLQDAPLNGRAVPGIGTLMPAAEGDHIADCGIGLRTDCKQGQQEYCQAAGQLFCDAHLNNLHF